MSIRVLTLVIALVAAACAPKRVDEEPILRNGERVPDPDATVEAVRQESEARRAEMAARRDELTAEALATCSGAICDALTRGEVALEMTEAQVLAATRTTDEAWRIRRNGRITVMVPRSMADAPRDALGTIGLWCELHGSSIAEAGMHHIECEFDFARCEADINAAGFGARPFSTEATAVSMKA